MRSSIRTMTCLIALAIGSMVPSMAKAETITATLTGLDPWAFGTLHLDGVGDDAGGIGNILWQGSSNNDSPFNGAFNTYCIDLIENIYFGGNYTFVVAPLQDAPKESAYPGDTGGPMGAGKANELAELFGQHYADTLPVGNGVEREAMQLAIWNIIYDTDTSVSTGAGAFYADGDVDPTAICIANCWLADAANPLDQELYHADDLEALIGCGGAQDQIVVNPTVTITTGVPQPAPALGGGLLIAGLALTQWRRHRQTLSNI
jgi:hypothetical protein